MTGSPTPRRYGWKAYWLATSLPAGMLAWYTVMGVSAVGLGYGSTVGSLGFWLSAVASAGLLVFCGFLVFVFLLFEDDWWNDTMWEQTTAYLLGRVSPVERG